MAQIFLSYAREDAPRIKPLVDAIEHAGLSVFWDRQIPPGRSWRDYIGAALGDAQCVLVAWSNDSVGSKWVVEEAEEAERRQVLVPFLLDPVVPPLGFRSIQAADLTAWDGAAESASLTSLLDHIRKLLVKTTAHEHAPIELSSAELPTQRKSRLTRRSAVVTAAAALTTVAVIGVGVWRTHQARLPSSEPTNQLSQPSPEPTDQLSRPLSAGGQVAFNLDKFRELRDYAYGSQGLNMDAAAAEKWAESRLKEDPDFDLQRFDTLVDYAYSASGLDLTRSGAAEWALTRLRENRSFDLKKFQELMMYAYGATGLNLSRSAAAEWALAKMQQSK